MAYKVLSPVASTVSAQKESMISGMFFKEVIVLLHIFSK